jgi:hypothetical protein
MTIDTPKSFVMSGTRMKLISVRVTDIQYEQIKALCRKHGNRSVSGLMRATVELILMHSDKTLIEVLIRDETAKGAAQASASIAELHQRVIELNRELELKRRMLNEH